MKYFTFNRHLGLALTVFLAVSSVFAQTVGKNTIDERNVRAQMGFLAGDAMQGRGSGTVFERIAAEYIGSQFMQFGLEPAGDTDAAGKPTFVQNVNISRNVFAGNPTLKYGSVSLEHGKEMVVLRANAAEISGGLQKLSLGDKPRTGAAVLVKLSEGDDPQKLMQGLQGMLSAGAAIVMIEETPQWRSAWANLAARRLQFTVSSKPAKPGAIVILGKDAATAINAAADGTKIDVGGTLGPVQKQQTWNAAGKINGSDKTLGSQIILLTSHLDHLGVRENAPGDDKIFNGADDDASGSVAVLELARLLAQGGRPKRTVYFVCFGSEEVGGTGATYFVDNLPFPKENLVANLEFEMIGRPDAAVKAEKLWLTGYERSNLGPELARRGAKLVQDPHPSENFFQRSDNYTLARQGIIAHTVSSFGLHSDYHRATDEVSTIDFTHMTRSITSMVEPIVWLVNSDFKPVWNEGKRP